MFVKPLPAGSTRLPVLSVEGLLVVAITALVYLVAISFDLDESILLPLDKLSLLGLHGDEFLLVSSFFGFAMLLYSVNRQRKLRRLAETLHGSERRFRALIENSSDGIVLFDDKGVVNYRSPANDRILGIPNPSVETSKVFELVHPDDLRRFQSTLGNLLTQPGQSVSLEYRVRHRDSSWRWLEAVATNLLADPSVRAVVANFRDITKRKQSEAELLESHAQFRTLFEASPDAIMLIDPHGNWPILDCNQCACKMNGYRRDELIGQSVDVLNVNPGNPAERAEYLERIRASGVIYVETFHRHKDGRWVPIEVATSLIELNGREVVLGIDRDITERRKSESQLALHASMLAQVRNAVIATDLDGRITYWNKFAETLYQWTADEVRGRSLSDVLIPQHFLGQASLALASLKQVGYLEGEFLVHRKDGSEFPTYFVDTVIQDAQGTPIGMVGVSSDITERKLADEHIRQQVGELSAINHISNALRAAMTLEELLDKLIDETLAMVGASIGSIWLYDAEKEDVRIAANRGGTITDPPPLRRGEGIPGTVVATGLPYRSRDFSLDPLIAPQTRVLVPPGQGGACIPIRSQTEAVGVLFVEVMLPRELSEAEVRLLTTVAEIAGIAIHRMRLYTQTERRLTRLAALRDIDLAISGSLDLQLILTLLVQEAVSQLQVDAASVLLADDEQHILNFAAGKGFRTEEMHHVRLSIGEGITGRAVRERKLISVPDIAADPDSVARVAAALREGFVCAYSMPLIAKGRITGVLDIFHRSPLAPDQEWKEFLEALARKAALAIDNAELFDHVQRSNFELSLAYDTTLEGWSRALDLRDKETEGHTLRVTELTMRLAQAMDFPSDELVHVRRGALLHDIGKMGVPDNILLKPGPLTADEWVLMRMHPVYARNLLAPIAYLSQALDIPYCHHEKWDGTGYPRGLAGEQIPRTARIFAVVDVWDALRSDRPYRPAWPVQRVLDHIRALSGSHFDPAVVDAFLKMKL